MRILFLLPDLGVGGGARVVFEYANRLEAKGHEVFVGSTEHSATVKWFPLETQVIPRSEVVRTANGCDVAIATGWHTAPIVYSLPVPVRVYFVQMRESLFYQNRRRQEFAEDTYALPFDKVITISSWLQKMLSEFGHDASIIPNGVNHKMFFPDPHFGKSNKPRVLIEGPRAFYKGIQEAFEATRDLPIELWHVSQEEPVEYADKVFIQPTQSKLRKIYSSCDIFLKASWYEGRPCSHVEAMACGCAVVSTRMYGTDDLVDGYNCLLVPRRDIEAIRKSVLTLANKESLRKRLIEGGFETVSNLKWERSAEQFESTLTETLRNTRTKTKSSKTTIGIITVFSQTQLEALRCKGGDVLSTLEGVDSIWIAADNERIDIESLSQLLPTIKRIVFSPRDLLSKLNELIMETEFDYVLIIDPQVKAWRDDWLECLIEKMSSNSKIGMIGPKIIDSDWIIRRGGGFRHAMWRYGDEPAHGYLGKGQAYYFQNSEFTCDFVSKECMLINRSALEKAGSFDTQIKLDDLDHTLGYRMDQMGFKALCFPQVLVQHQTPTSTRSKHLTYLFKQAVEALRVGGIKLLGIKAINWLEWAKQRL